MNRYTVRCRVDSPATREQIQQLWVIGNRVEPVTTRLFEWFADCRATSIATAMLWAEQHLTEILDEFELLGVTVDRLAD